jgi:hypothetical protein
MVLLAKHTLFLSDFNKTRIFSRISKKKNTQISHFIKIRPLGIELFHAVRYDEANSRLSQFYERVYKRQTVIQNLNLHYFLLKS